MQDVKVNGREFAVEFEHSSQGHRLTVMEWDGDEWQTLPNYNGALCLGATHFESLCNLSSYLFQDSVYGETFAELLGIPMRSSDDVKCERCDVWNHYESEDMVHGTDMLPEILDALALGNWDYLCLDCYLTALTKYQVVENA